MLLWNLYMFAFDAYAAVAAAVVAGGGDGSDAGVVE